MTRPRLLLALLLVVCLGYWAYRSQEPRWIEGPPGRSSYINEPPPPSPWIEKERAWASSRLAKSSADFLVPPFQVDGSPFDVVERNLLARSVATGLAQTYGATVADTTLVEQALGTGARTFKIEDVTRLATETHAKVIVLGFIGHDEGQTFHVRIETLSIEGGTGAKQPRVVATYEGLPFSDPEPPYFAFQKLKDDVLAAVTGGARPPVPRVAARHDVPAIPGSIGDLDKNRPPFERAYLLELLAALHPRGIYDRPQERLLERALVALENTEETDASRALRARAWLYLHRRPVAVALLAEPKSPEEKALRAFADGDLETLTQTVARLSDPILNFISTLELQYLASLYERPADSDVVTQLEAAHPFLAPLSGQALSELDDLDPHFQAFPKIALDSYFPLPQFDYDQATERAMRQGKLPEQADILRLCFDHLSAVRDALPPTAASDEKLSVELLDLVEQSLVANVVDSARHLRTFVAVPAQALERITEVEPLLEGHPDFTIERGLIEVDLGRHAPKPESESLTELGRQHLKHGLLWSEGQTEYALEALHAHPDQWLMHWLFNKDWPTRANWSSGDGVQCLAYTIANIDCLITAYVAKGAAAAAPLISESQHRFIGHPYRVSVLATIQYGVGKDDVTTYADAVASGSTEWTPYYQLGTRLAKDVKPKEALATFLKYPGFRGTPTETGVAVSNYAEEAGSQLYWSGAYEEARPLYEFASALGTGSEAEMMARMRLALLDRTFDKALAETGARVRRYGSQYSHRDLALLLNAFGDDKRAWETLNGLAGRWKEPELWIGPYALHRRSGASLSAIRDWAFDPERAQQRWWLDSLALRYIVLSEVVDRKPTADLADVLRSNDPLQHLVEGRGTSTLKATPNGPSPFFGESTDPAVRVAIEPDASRLPLLTAGLAQLADGNSAAAFDAFDSASRARELREFLPYYAWVAGLLGRTQRVETYLTNSVRERTPRVRADRETLFDEHLALAALHGIKGEDATALEHLRKASANIPNTQDRSIFPRYQILEVAELLFARTGAAGYKTFLVDRARRFSIVDPMHSWTHAFLALYSDDGAERRRALASALYLDPLSLHASRASADDLAAARATLARGNPFAVKPGKSL